MESCGTEQVKRILEGYYWFNFHRHWITKLQYDNKAVKRALLCHREDTRKQSVFDTKVNKFANLGSFFSEDLEFLPFFSGNLKGN